MEPDSYLRLRAQARGLARTEADAEDLVQEALLAALRAGRSDAAWLAGVLRKQAALQARGAVRRRRRERAAADDAAAGAPPETGSGDASVPVPDWLRRLPPAGRRVAVLALHGLSAEEIRWILGLSPAAFRQRLTGIRKALAGLRPAERAESLALAYVRDPARSVELQFGLVRRALKAALRGGAGLGTHDGDGHLLVIRRRAHVPAPGGNG
ncbi:RNA polymerase sigma factor [Luteimonas aquatica]|uniref:RNA polymerase sigma factor n=1 Tax=Luteimonas aquatica TaxID=450364 RepID=UPI001F58F312|nr:hypothetical protein [Luteimonas aquatica]